MAPRAATPSAPGGSTTTTIQYTAVSPPSIHPKIQYTSHVPLPPVKSIPSAAVLNQQSNSSSATASATATAASTTVNGTGSHGSHSAGHGHEHKPKARKTAAASSTAHAAASNSHNNSTATVSAARESLANGAQTVNGDVTSSMISNNSNFSTASLSFDWPNVPPQFLHSYRHTYRLPVPASFNSQLNGTILSHDGEGIGKLSPTICASSKRERRTPKEKLARACRRHFNDLAVSETEVIVEFLYTCRWQGGFRMKFGPQGVMKRGA